MSLTSEDKKYTTDQNYVIDGVSLMYLFNFWSKIKSYSFDDSDIPDY